MLKRLLLAVLVLLMPAGALANDDLEGAWALRIDGANIFRFDLRQIEDGVWRGTWARPESFGSNGMVFSRLVGSEEIASMAGLDLDGAVELSFDDPRPGAIPDIFRFSFIETGRIDMIYVGTSFPPYPLVRVAPDAPLGPFQAGRIYDRDNADTVSEYQPEAQADVSNPNAERPFQSDVEFLDLPLLDDAVAAAQGQAEPEPDNAAQAEPAPDEETREEQDTPAPSLIGDDFLDGL